MGVENLDRNRVRWSPVEWVLLVLVYAFTLASVAGYATFGVHPSLLARWPGAAEFYGVAFLFFPRGQVLLAFMVLGVALTYRVGWRWLGPFVVVYGLSLGAELLGTVTGVPFGAYAYGGALGAKWLDRVPVLIPLSWWFMALPSWVLARRVYPVRVVPAVFLGALLLALWDLSLDPAMSHATSYWTWESEGAFYGMPWVNLLGRYVTGLVLMASLAFLGVDEWAGRLSDRWLAVFYASNVLLSWGMVVASGLVWAALLTPLAYAVVVFALYGRGGEDGLVMSIEAARAAVARRSAGQEGGRSWR